MSPQAGAAARRQAPARVPERRAERAEPRRHTLRLVERPARRRRRIARKLAGALVLSSLVTVVVGHAVLAEEQVKLSIAESQLSAEQSAHRQDVLALAQRETPARVVAQAEALHMTTPGGIVQLPHVPLSAPLATPTVAPAPADSTSPPPTSTAPAATSTTPAPSSTTGTPAVAKPATTTRATATRATATRATARRKTAGSSPGR